jgi:putative DNA-invertase from lambdoid prophage Rac
MPLKDDVFGQDAPSTSMARTFAYIRVSTSGQTTENQLREMEAAGFAVDKRRIVSETVSGSSVIEQRLGFVKLMDRLERDDVLIVTKLDCLGRNAMDLTATVAKLADMGVRVHCLALGGADFASAAGRMTMQVINAVAQFERDLLIERTNSSLARAKASGEKLGGPKVLDDKRKRQCGAPGGRHSVRSGQAALYQPPDDHEGARRGG